MNSDNIKNCNNINASPVTADSANPISDPKPDPLQHKPQSQREAGDLPDPVPDPDDVHDHAETSRYRVLMIAPTSFFADYGCHVRILEEARTLQRLGHDVTIATYHNGYSPPGLDIRRSLPIPWRRDYEVGSSRHKIAFDMLLGLRIWQTLFTGNYDVIHAHLHEGALMALVIGRLFHIPVVFDFQGSLTEEMLDHHFMQRDSLLYKPLRRLEKWINQSSPVILTSSAHAERILVEQFGCAEERVHFLPDCVNAESFRPADTFDPTELADLRQQLGIPAHARVIVYLGLLAEYQGTGLLLEAFQRILGTQDDVYLLLMGFPGVEVYRQQARLLGVEDRVIFTGRIPYERSPEYLALGDVAVAPKLSLTEGCGKLLNYMAAALPTVAFETPVAREYLGADGLLAERGNVESLAANLDAVLNPAADTPNIYVDAGRRLRQRASQHFEWLNAGRAIVRTYQRLIEGTSGDRQRDVTRTTQYLARNQENNCTERSKAEYCTARATGNDTARDTKETRGDAVAQSFAVTRR